MKNLEVSKSLFHCLYFNEFVVKKRFHCDLRYMDGCVGQIALLIGLQIIVVKKQENEIIHNFTKKHTTQPKMKPAFSEKLAAFDNTSGLLVFENFFTSIFTMA